MALRMGVMRHPFTSSQSKPGFPHRDLNTITALHKADNFTAALETFITIVYILLLQYEFSLIFWIISTYISASLFAINQSLRLRTSLWTEFDATPEVPAHARLNAVPAHFGTVLVRTEEVNEHTRGTFLEGNVVFWVFF